MARRRLLSGILLLAATLAACASPPPKSTISLEVEYAGCKSVLVPGPVCVPRPKDALWLWVESPPGARIDIRAGGRRIDAAGEPVGEGQQFIFKVPLGAERLDVLVETPQGQAAWSLALAPQTRQAGSGASRDVLREIRETPWEDLIYDRRFAEVRERLDRLRTGGREPAEARYLMRFYRGMIAEKEGDYRSALSETQSAAEIAERVLWEDLRWATQEQMGLLLLEVGRFREAAELFARLGRPGSRRGSCERAELLNNQAWAALLGREAGESFPDPTPLFAEALRTYGTCDRFVTADRLNILINLAWAHLQEGRLWQAKALLAETRVLVQSAASFYKLWWHDLEARIALEERPAEALRLFERLEEIALAAGSSADPSRAVFGQARAHQALRNPAAALEALRRAEALLDGQSLQVPLHEGRETFIATRQGIVSLHIDLLLAQGRNGEALDVARHARSRMLRQMERSDRLANLTSDRREQWERLLREYQQRRQALEKEAQDDWALPTDQLRRQQAARQADADTAQRLLDRAFLLLGDSGDRRQEPPPRPGELILTYHSLPPLPGQPHRWVGFAADGRSLRVHPFDLPPGDLPGPEELSRRLLLPFRPSILRAQRLRILPGGPLQGVDFHALPFAGDPLLARLPVAYGLDLPVPPGPAEPSGRRALLVTDPQGDLPGAREEARTVHEILGSQAPPWAVEELAAAAASTAAVRDRLADADLLHYAGHGTFSGFGGWESSLHLAGETRLTLGDLLALGRVPAWVVLSACDGGRSSAGTPVEGLGLAHAFLLAGSRAVIASTRPADDRTVPVLFAELYRLWDREPDPAAALRRAQLAWRQRDPGADWSAFRLVEP